MVETTFTKQEDEIRKQIDMVQRGIIELYSAVDETKKFETMCTLMEYDLPYLRTLVHGAHELID